MCCAPESYCLKLSTATVVAAGALATVWWNRLQLPLNCRQYLQNCSQSFFSPVVVKIFISLDDVRDDFQSDNESTALDTWRRKCDLAIESAFWPCWTLCAIESKNWVKCQLSQNQTQGKHIWKTRQKLVTAKSQSQSWKAQWNITVTFFNLAQKTKIQILIKENI